LDQEIHPVIQWVTLLLGFGLPLHAGGTAQGRWLIPLASDYLP
jgi:hypothetical protein